MKVLFLIPDLAYGSAARQLTLLAANLPRERFTVGVATLRPDTPWSRALRDGGIPVEGGRRRRRWDLRPLMAAWCRFTPDVIHLFAPRAPDLLALTWGSGGGRVVLSAAVPGERATRLGFLERWGIGRLAERVTVRGPVEAEHYRRLGIPVAKLVQVPPGVPVAAPPRVPHADWCRSLGLPPNARVIVGVGPLEPAKGFRDAVWAYDILQFLYDDLHLLLVGAGPQEPRLRQFIQVTRSTGRVHLLGARADLDEVLGHAELVWVPSRADCGRTVALEAMAAGRPVVASRWPGLAEVVADGETGVLVAPGDKAALARATRALLDDPERRQRLGEAGRRRATECFGVGAMVRGFEALYATLAPV